MLFHFFSKCTHDAFRVRCQSICTDKQPLHKLTTRTSTLQKKINERAISVLTHHSCKPQPTCYIHRESHPNNDFPALCSYLIGLNVLAPYLALLHDLLMNVFAMDSCTLLPGGYRALVEDVSMNNRLPWTSIRQKSYHSLNRLLVGT